MTELTEKDVISGLAAKSDQLNAVDLVVAPVTVSIVGVRVGDKDCPWFVDLAEYPKRPFKPCVTMRRLMVHVMGKDPEHWPGQRMTLYRDPQVKYMGDTVGGVRISHFSALSEPETVELSGGHGPKIQWSVCPVAPDDAVPSGPAYRVNDIKKAWSKYAAEMIEGLTEQETRQQFGAWLTQTVGEYDTGMLDTDGAQFWTVEQFEKCEEALK